MKILPNKKYRSLDYRWIADLQDYHKLTPEQLDIAVHGVPFEGKRYPLCYVFWNKYKWRKVIVLLTGESGVQIGESIMELPTRAFTRAIIKIADGRVTDLSYSVIRNL